MARDRAYSWSIARLKLRFGSAQFRRANSGVTSSQISARHSRAVREQQAAQQDTLRCVARHRSSVGRLDRGVQGSDDSGMERAFHMFHDDVRMLCDVDGLVDQIQDHQTASELGQCDELVPESLDVH